MSAEIFMDYLEKRGKSASLFFTKITSVGIFALRNIEARVSKKLDPLEKFTLGICKEFGTISRVELFVLSGHSMEICEETIKQLEYHDLIELQDFDRVVLENNLDRISNNIGEEWKSPTIQRILRRNYLKTYSITKPGQKALRIGKKAILDSVDLDLLITSKPLHLAYERALPKAHGYETIDMSPDMVYTVLSFASEFSNDTGVEPISLTPSTIASGVEIVTANLWVGISQMNGNGENSIRYNPFISSNALEKWIPLETTKNIIANIPQTKNVLHVVSSAISYTFDMVQEVVQEGLELTKNNRWKFTCDLEMLMLVDHVNSIPIKEVQPETALKLLDSEWRVIINFELVPEDELAFSGLAAARFHANVPRGGFRLSQGYDLWNKILKEWDRKTSYSEYKSIIDLLKNNNCLKEILPEIVGIVVDAENILAQNKRGTQTWEFNRLRQIDNLLTEAGIENRLYIGDSNISQKIDEIEIFEDWIKDGKMMIFDDITETHPSFSVALEKNFHYLGNRKRPVNDEFKEMRRNMKFIKYHIENKKVVISKLEPFFEFANESILEKLYDQYYE